MFEKLFFDLTGRVSDLIAADMVGMLGILLECTSVDWLVLDKVHTTTRGK